MTNSRSSTPSKPLPPNPAIVDGTTLALPFELDLEAQRAQALARLEASRQALREAIIDPKLEAAADERAARRDGRRQRARWQAWIERSPFAPVFGTVSGAFRGWWRAQPWRNSAELAGSAVSDQVLPLIRRHPMVAVLVALGVGAAIAAVSPWRWRAVRGQAQSARHWATSWALTQLGNPAVQMAIAGALATFLGERMGERKKEREQDEQTQRAAARDGDEAMPGGEPEAWNPAAAAAGARGPARGPQPRGEESGSGAAAFVNAAAAPLAQPVVAAPPAFADRADAVTR